MVFLIRSLQQGTGWLQAGTGIVLSAVTMALALSTRILGIFLVAVFVLVMLILLIQVPKRWMGILSTTILTLVGMLGFTMCRSGQSCRPNPLGGLVTAFTYMSHYPYDPPNLYFGTFIARGQITLGITCPSGCRLPIPCIQVTISVLVGRHCNSALNLYTQLTFKEYLRNVINSFSHFRIREQ